MATAVQAGELSTAPRPRANPVRGRRQRVRLNAGFAAMSLLTVVVAFLVLFPICMLLFGSFWTARPGFPGTLTLQNYIAAYTSLETYQVLVTTVLLMGGKTVLAVALATTLAWIVTRTDTPGRGLLEVLITLPFFIPGLLEAIGWIELLSPNAGTINVWLRSTLGLPSAFNIYSLGGMIWVLSLGSTSFIFLLVVNALRNMDASLEESARASGAGAVRTALTVTLPLMAPIILSAGLLSFIRAMDAFEVPVLLGLPAKVMVFSNRIYAAVEYDYPVNYGLATALGVSFVALMLVLIYFQNRLLRGRDYSVVTGKGYKPRVVRLGRFRYVTLAFCLLYFGIATLLPLSQVFIGSFLKVFGLPRADLFTFDNYLAILSDATLWRGLINTFIVCGAAAAVTVLLCALIAYTFTRTHFIGRRPLEILSWLPWAIPGIVAGLGMLWAYITLPVPLYGTLLLLVIVLLTTGLPLGSRVMSGSMVQFGRELEESSRVHGAGWLYTFTHILAPLLKPALAGAFLLVFVSFSRAVSTTILFVGPGTELLAVTLFSYSQAGKFAIVSALAIVLMLINVTALVIARRMGAFGDGAHL
ncbi:MAG: iron ABC transporter permease [Chloroflexi bacterium]|nr:iron ABC transporter permease [Chloroflexota bacterium]